MKRFVFRLEPLLKYKLTVEQKQKGELATANAKLRALQEELKAMSDLFTRNAQELAAVLLEKSEAGELEKYSNYLRHLSEQRRRQLALIEQAQAVVRECQRVLIITMREVKTLTSLKEEQFRLYLEEVRAEEAKEIGDIVSYQTVAAVSE